MLGTASVFHYLAHNGPVTKRQIAKALRAPLPEVDSALQHLVPHEVEMQGISPYITYRAKTLTPAA